MAEQMALQVEACKEPGCNGQIVGTSILGEGKVCAVHNRLEWAWSLSRPHQPSWVKAIGAELATPDPDTKEGGTTDG